MPNVRKKKSKLKVINLFGAPGTGKSSVRSGLFWLMKSHHFSVEEVTEYAKYLVLSGRSWQLKAEQLYLLAKQSHKQNIVGRTKYEYAVTDSPLLLCQFYAPKKSHAAFEDFVDQVNADYDNYNFFLTRDLSNDFEGRGRVHNRDQAIELEVKMRAMLDKKGVSYIDVPVDFRTPWAILEHLGFKDLVYPTIGEGGFKVLSYLLATDSDGNVWATLDRKLSKEGPNRWAVHLRGERVLSQSQEILRVGRGSEWSPEERLAHSFESPAQAVGLWLDHFNQNSASYRERGICLAT